MDKPKDEKHYYTGATAFQARLQAEEEIAYENWRKLVDLKKQELLTYKPWYVKLFPFKVTIERLNG